MRSAALIRARASERYERAREALALRIERAPSLSLGVVLVGLWLTSLGAVGLWVKSSRDQVWRSRLIESSASVRRVVTETNTAAALSDERLVATIGDIDARLESAERALRTRPAASDPGRCDGVPGDTPGLRKGNSQR